MCEETAPVAQELDALRQENARLRAEVEQLRSAQETLCAQGDGQGVVLGIARDITERKQAENALRGSKALLEAIAHIQSSFIADADPRVLFHELLDTAVSITGSGHGFLGETPYGADGVPYVKVHALTNTHWDEASQRLYEEHAATGLEFRRLGTLFGAALRTGEPVIANSPTEDPRQGGLPEGHPELRSFLAIPLHCGPRLVGLLGLANRPAGYTEELLEHLRPLVATCARIIEAYRNEQARRQAESALQESERRYSSLFHNNHAAMLLVDPETAAITDANPAACAFYGYIKADLLSRKITDINQLSAEEVFQALARARREERNHFLFPHRLANGEVRDVEVYGGPITVDGKQLLCSIIHDVTDRRRAETELRETKARLQALVDASPLAVIVVDTSQRVTQWNRAAECLFGWSAEEVLGMPYPVVPPTHRAEFEQQWKGMLKGKSFSQLETQRIRRDGSLVEVSVSTAPLRDASGRIVGIMALVADITERLRLQRELRQALKMQAVGQLAGGVAHDFNNALMPIMTYSDYLLQRLHAEDPLRHYAERVAQAAESAASLPRQLLAFSRKQVLQPKIVNLNDIVAGLTKMLRRVLGEQIEIVSGLSPTLEAVKADPGQIEQVLMNLAVNARDAMPDGGTLSIETTTRELDESYCRLHPNVTPGRYVVLAVSDTGCGMDQETQARIFEPFFTTKEQGKGTGLGLPTVYGIVTQSGGQVRVSSTPGRGSTFRVYLPAVGEATASAGFVARAIPSGGSETILLAEDEEVVRQGIREMLRAYGYTVLEAGNGEQALSLAERHRGAIDLLLTDVVMPGMGGRQLAERLLRLRPGIRVVYMSGYTEDAIIHQGVRASGLEFLQKPFPGSLLASKLREVLDGGRSSAPE